MTRIGKIDITPAVEPSRCVALQADGKLLYERWLSPWARCPEAPGLRVSDVPAELRNPIHDCAEGAAPWPLFVHGKPGTGKTYTAALAHRHFGGWIGTLSDWCEVVLMAKRESLTWSSGARAWEADLWEHWRRVPLVIVDELGLRKPSDAAYETLARMLNERANRPAIWISNHDAAGLLAVYDDRIVSRLQAGTVVKLGGKDRRIRK